MRDSKGVMCYSRTSKAGAKYTTCMDKTNKQLRKGAKPKQSKYKSEPIPTRKDELRKMSVIELRKLARGRGKSTEVSKMRKEELVQMLSKQPK